MCKMSQNEPGGAAGEVIVEPVHVAMVGLNQSGMMTLAMTFESEVGVPFAGLAA